MHVKIGTVNIWGEILEWWGWEAGDAISPSHALDWPIQPTYNKPLRITGSAVALHCCKAHAKINRKMGNWPPVKSWPLKISSWNFAHVITSARLPAMQILVLIGTVGASPQIGEILVTFLTVLTYLFSILRPGRTAGPIFTLYGSNDVFPRKDGHFGG